MKTKEELKHAVLETINAEQQKILAIGETLWKNPEPGYQEVKAAKLAADIFTSLNLPLKEHLAVTGMRADLDSGRNGPTLALLGEMDSLIMPEHPEADPETGAVHACGHNAIITALLGAAIGLVKSGVLAGLSGKIAFISVPAEEAIEFDKRLEMIRAEKIRYLSGKAEMIREGVFDDVDIACMIHAGKTRYRYANHNGALIKRVTFHGKSSHAGSLPSNGINAMNALTLAQVAIGMLRETFLTRDRVHGIITRGGDSANIIPNITSMEYYIRASQLERLRELNRIFDRAVTSCAEAIGATVKILTEPGFMPEEPDLELQKLYRAVIAELFPDTKFTDKCIDMTGSTDMGDVSQIVPSIHAYSSGCAGTFHGTDFRIDDPHKAYIDSSKVLAVMAVELLYDDAGLGRKIAKNKEKKMTIPHYLKLMESLKNQ
jgi:amidohydrolase